MRYAVLLLARFALQAVLRHRQELWAAPVAVMGGEPRHAVVRAATLKAEAVGVVAGLSSSQALARCPALQIFEPSPAAEETLQAVLLDFAGSLSSRVEDTGDGVCTLDLESARIRDHAQWARQTVQRAKALNLRLKIGVAVNPDLALLAAESARPVRVVNESMDFLRGLPLDALRPPPHLRRILGDWGIHDAAALAGLPREQVAERLGPDGNALWVRAAGRRERILELVRPAEVYEEAVDFECEVETAEPLLFMLRKFLDQLVRRLKGCGRVAKSLELVLELSNGGNHRRFFSIPAPTAEAEVLFRIIDTHLEQLRLEDPAVGMRLALEPADPEARQFQLFDPALRDPNRFAETLARLKALAGEDRVGVPELLATHRPDRFRLNPPDFDAERSAVVREEEPATAGLPLRRFRPPFPARVRTSGGGAPMHLQSAQAGGEVAGSYGPYRLSGEWWREDQWCVEWWDVAVGGGLLRLARDGNGWWVEGCYEQEAWNLE